MKCECGSLRLGYTSKLGHSTWCEWDPDALPVKPRKGDPFTFTMKGCFSLASPIASYSALLKEVYADCAQKILEQKVKLERTGVGQYRVDLAPREDLKLEGLKAWLPDDDTFTLKAFPTSGAASRAQDDYVRDALGRLEAIHRRAA